MTQYSDSHSKILNDLKERQPLLLLISVSLVTGTFATNPLVKGLAIAAFGSFLLSALVSFYLTIRTGSERSELVRGILGLTFLLQLLIGIGFLVLAGLGILAEAGALAVLPAPFWLSILSLIGVTVWSEYKSIPLDMPSSLMLKIHKVAAVGLLALLPAFAINNAGSPWLLGEEIHRFVSGVLALPDLLWIAFFLIWIYTTSRIHMPPPDLDRNEVAPKKE